MLEVPPQWHLVICFLPAFAISYTIRAIKYAVNTSYEVA